ncbi:MAG: Tm-1-like ATP-binding domain-containing protein, partial [Actinomycetota bacterium]|nr:Tm-1-like ATP-binding domain-containing protein [Actinomycetota bacterium]
MVQAPPVEVAGGRPLVAATMFGVTTPCVTRARER